MTSRLEGADPYYAVLVDLEAQRDEINKSIQLVGRLRRGKANNDAEVRNTALEEAAQLVEAHVSESEWFAELAAEATKIATAIRGLKS